MADLDPVLERLHAKARQQNALLAAIAILGMASILIGVFAEAGLLGGRRMGLLIAGGAIVLPAFLLNGALPDNSLVAVIATGALVTVAGYVATGAIGVAAASGLTGAAAAWTYGRIATNTNYRPKLLPAAIEKARKAAEQNRG